MNIYILVSMGEDRVFSRASRMLRSATQVVRMSCVCGNFFPTNPYLQAGLTDLDEIWHDGSS